MALQVTHGRRWAWRLQVNEGVVMVSVIFLAASIVLCMIGGATVSAAIGNKSSIEAWISAFIFLCAMGLAYAAGAIS